MFPTSPMALRWCGPPKKGLEVGASAWNPFGLDARNVAPPDRADHEFYAAHGRDAYGLEPAPVDVWAEGDDVPLPDSSQDFVLNSHVLEHMPDPLRALREWHRLCKPGGVVYCVVPHRDAHPPDRDRPVSTLGQLLEAERERRRVGQETPPDAGGPRGHLWVWDVDLFRSCLAHLAGSRPACVYEVLEEAGSDDKVGNGFVFVLGVVKIRVSGVGSGVSGVGCGPDGTPDPMSGAEGDRQV